MADAGWLAALWCQRPKLRRLREVKALLLITTQLTASLTHFRPEKADDPEETLALNQPTTGRAGWLAGGASAAVADADTSCSFPQLLSNKRTEDQPEGVVI